MKTQRLFVLLAAMVLPLAIWANLIVKGHITYQNGQPANYYSVFIESNDSSTCPSVHLKYTNANGIYQDTLVCNNPIFKLRVWIRDCNNIPIYHDLLVPNGAVIIETNFTTCNPGVCKAYFLSNPVANATNSIQFDSKNSTTNAGDSIIARKWMFGDGDSASGNVVALDHHYQKPGNYTVCLQIKSAFGCESNICNAINVTQLAGTCHANFSFAPVLPQLSPGNYSISFNSIASTTAPNDSIIARYWDFGDGIILNGNIQNPMHTYTISGIHQVYLKIRSAGGCYDSIYQPITVPPFKCQANFNYALISNGSYFHFDAQPSQVVPGDSIVQYNWTLGDGSTATIKSFDHNFIKTSSYNVCLAITTAKGCKDVFCSFVGVASIRTCHAQFTYLPTTNATNNIHFNGQTSTTAVGDSIIKYTWDFGDGSTANTKDPYHTFTKGGNYLVCLAIISKYGCTDSVCTKIIVGIPPPTTCAANFNFTDTGLNGHFNSSQINISQGDSIISRNWNFGDGQSLSGNTISPVYHYKYGGNYQACLKVTTRLGCASEVCRTVHITGDSIPSNIQFLKIINAYPNPATTQFNTIIASRYNNVDATLEIYDVYGTLKWSSKKILSQGNNNIPIPISQLVSGPYIFKVTTIYGVDSKRFFKL